MLKFRRMKISALLHRLNRRDVRILPRVPTYTKFILIAVSIIGVSLLVKNIFAQTFTSEYTNNNLIKQKQDAIKKGNNQEAWLNESMGSNIVSALSALVGEIPDDVISGKTTSWIPGGMVGGVNKIAANMYAPPSSGVSYIAQVKDSFLGKPAYAQNGVGFSSLQPLLPFWKIFRNALYVISSLFFVIVGLFIMLRVKISPQATISIQSSIPKIIITLILITFSYAISGLLIDLSNLIQAILISLIFNSQNVAYTKDLFFEVGSNTQKFSDNMTTISSILSNPVSFFGDIVFPDNYSALSNMSILRFNSIVSQIIPIGTVAIFGIVAGAVVGTFFGPGLGNLAGAGIGGALFVLIISIYTFIQVCKTFISLVKCYFSVIIHIIMAPFEIAVGALPNSKQGFGSWMTNVVANLAVFPVMTTFVVIVALIIKKMDTFGAALWTPSLLSGMGGIWFIKFIIGLAAIMILPKLPALIIENVFQIKPSPYGKALGESFNDSFVGKAAATIKKGSQEYGASTVAGMYNRGLGRLGAETNQFLKTNDATKEAYAKYQEKRAERMQKRKERYNDTTNGDH